MKKNKPFRELFSSSLKKILKIMRNALILLFIGVLQAHAIDTYSQKTRLSLNFSNTELTKVLDKIEAESEFFFLYNEKLLDIDRKVSINANDQFINVILDDLFAGTNVKYTIIDRKIILAPDYLTEVSQPQQKQISGKIIDENGNLLPGVNIQIEGTILGAMSDASGKYIINVPGDNAVLVFSFIGYKTQKVPVSGRTSVDITLMPDLTTLEEVIVVGYGTVKKSDLTGSVGSVTSDKLVAFPTTDVLKSLQGKVAGLTISSNNGGAPGATSTIRIRGGASITTSSDPLWVVDGFPGAAQPQAEDIQSIEVLRDASSCAIYGSRGSNGVILVTTKKGTAGSLKVEANVSYTILNVSKKIDVLDGPGYAKFFNDYQVNHGQAVAFSPDSISKVTNTNWQDLVFRTGSLQTYQVSVSGGSEKVKVYSSAKYSNENGIIINSSRNFFTGKLNVDANVTDKTTVGTHVDYGHWTANNISSQTFFTGYGGISSTALSFEPVLGIYQADGVTYTEAQHSFGGASDNPYANAVEPIRQNVYDNVSTNMYLDHEILKGLKFYISLGLQLSSNRQGNAIPVTLINNILRGSASLQSNRDINLNNTAYLTYDKTFADIHKITLMAGHDYQSSNHEDFTAGSSQFPGTGLGFWNLGSGALPASPSSNTNSWIIESFYGRLNYIMKDRYMLTFTGREDGSSRFAEGHKWGFFPSVAARWNISKEAFMQSIPAISQLDLHAGYGTNGNTGIGSYASLPTFTTYDILAYFNGNLQNAVAPNTVASNSLGWETSKATNIGVDLALFKNALTFSAEWYNRESSNMLFSLPLPLYTGYQTMNLNTGDFRNRGVEFTLGGDLTRGDFNWSSDFNISFNNSKVISLPNGDIFTGHSPVNNDYTFIVRQGETTNAIYGYVYTGVDPATGNATYADLNNDGVVNGKDRKILGSANPKFTYGWVNNFVYKGYDLNIQINGSYGNKMINATRMELETMFTPNNTTAAYYSAWTPTNTITDVPKVGSASGYIYSSRWVEDASYLRVQNIALGYSLPTSVAKMLEISKCRIYVSVQNAFLLTKYKGYDPEVFWNPQSNSFDANTSRGLDYDSYPNTRNYTIGIQVTF